MSYEDDPKSIKFYVKRHLLRNAARFKGLTVIDFPAGNGVTSRLLAETGATPVALDLFPEYFRQEGLSCARADIAEGLPLADRCADALVCQEGIEHFSDQYRALREFNRVLKKGGLLLITTPNYSNLQSKLSYLLTESERFNTFMAPNELDSVWFSDQQLTSGIYFGHVFLTGIQKLRVLATLAGFRIAKLHFTRARSTSLLLLPLFYPFILLSNVLTLRRNMRKNRRVDAATKRRVYGEVFRLAISPKVLTCADLMVEFEKEQEADEVGGSLRNVYACETMVT